MIRPLGQLVLLAICCACFYHCPARPNCGACQVDNDCFSNQTCQSGRCVAEGQSVSLCSADEPRTEPLMRDEVTSSPDGEKARSERHPKEPPIGPDDQIQGEPLEVGDEPSHEQKVTSEPRSDDGGVTEPSPDLPGPDTRKACQSDGDCASGYTCCKGACLSQGAWFASIDATKTFVRAVASDSAGRVYIAGQYDGNATFGKQTFTADISGSSYIASFDSAGLLLWAKDIAGADCRSLRSHTESGKDFVYLSCSFTNTSKVVFDTKHTSPRSITPSGQSDAEGAIFKLDASGALVWLKESAAAFDIGVDAKGDVYLAGTFYNRARFGTTQLVNESGVSRDIFAAKLDAKGNWRWAYSAGDKATDEITLSMYVSPKGVLYMGCEYPGYLKDIFGSGVDASGSGGNFLVIKVDASGKAIWAKSFPFPPITLTADQDDNVYVSGSYQGSISFGTNKLSSATTRIFIARLDKNGTSEWAIDTKGDANVRHILYRDKLLYVSGWFRNDTTFGSTTLSHISPPPHDNATFAAAFDGAKRAFVWAKGGGGTIHDNLMTDGLALGACDALYVTGSVTLKTASFGTFTATPKGRSGFIWKP